MVHNGYKLSLLVLESCGAHCVVAHGTGRRGESASRRRAGGSLRVCCVATVLNAALAWLGLSMAMAVVHVYRTVLHGFALC